MTLHDTARMFLYHKRLTEANGEGHFGALGWTSREAQLARYGILSQAGDLDHCSVLDAGCGYGEFCDFLHKKFTGIRYYGVDHMPMMIEKAVRLQSMYPASFIQADFMTAALPVCDYSFACGSLNYTNSDPLYIYRSIEKLFSLARIGTAFNLLKEACLDNGMLATYEPQEILGFCSRLTKKYRLEEGYIPGDFTIYLYH